jgi:hypothetical protein
MRVFMYTLHAYIYIYIYIYISHFRTSAQLKDSSFTPGETSLSGESVSTLGCVPAKYKNVCEYVYEYMSVYMYKYMQTSECMYVFVEVHECIHV